MNRLTPWIALRTGCAILALSAFLISSSTAGPIPVPTGLSPGDTYQLVFVSSAGTTAASGSIGTYDAIVQGLANSAGIGVSKGLSWKTIGSTSAVNARDHAVVSGPVYDMLGDLVANDYDDMWDETLQSSISRTETAVFYNGSVWTGTRENGLKGPGTAYLGSSIVTYGSANQQSSTWIRQASFLNDGNRRLYSLSSVIVVVPEPGTGTILITGLVAALAWRRRA